MSFQLQLETISWKFELCASLTLQFEIGKTTEKGGLCFLGSRQTLGLPCSLAFGSCSWLCIDIKRFGLGKKSLVSVSENFDIGEKVGKDLVSRSVASPVLKDISAAQKMFPRFAVVHRCMCIYIIYYILGTRHTAKSDEFSDKFQTAFDPPPSFS